MVQLIDYASESQIAKLFRGAFLGKMFPQTAGDKLRNLSMAMHVTGFYPTELDSESPMPEHFAAEVKKMGLDVSMADLQGHLLRHKGEPLEVSRKRVVDSRELLGIPMALMFAWWNRL
jgi:hypothetical protein